MAWYLKEGTQNPLQNIPRRIRVPDAQFPGGNRTYTGEAVSDHLSEAGYTEVPDPPSFDKDTQRLDWANGEGTVNERASKPGYESYVDDPTVGWRFRGDPDPADFESVEAWLEHVNG